MCVFERTKMPIGRTENFNHLLSQMRSTQIANSAQYLTLQQHWLWLINRDEQEDHNMITASSFNSHCQNVNLCAVSLFFFSRHPLTRIQNWLESANASRYAWPYDYDIRNVLLLYFKFTVPTKQKDYFGNRTWYVQYSQKKNARCQDNVQPRKKNFANLPQCAILRS